MIILKKSKYQSEQRSLVDSLLDLRYSKNGVSLDKQQVVFNAGFNITAQDYWSISFICSVDSFTRTSTINNTTFGTLFSKQDQVPHNTRRKLKGFLIGYRKNTGVAGDYGNPAMPLDRYRLELMLCDGVSAQQQWSFTGFNFSKDALLHIVVTCQDYHNLSTYKIFVNSVTEPLTHYFTPVLNRVGITSENDYKIGYAEFDMGSFNMNSYGFNGHLSHPMIFSKILSEKEILELHATGGIVPESAQSYVQEHLPLTQGYGKTVYSAAEQYNYKKLPGLTNPHFDTGIANWYLFVPQEASAILTWDAANTAAKIEITTAPAVNLQKVQIKQDFSVKAGEIYTAKCRVRNVSQHSMVLLVQFGWGRIIDTRPIPPNEWVTIEGTFVSPGNFSDVALSLEQRINDPNAKLVTGDVLLVDYIEVIHRMNIVQAQHGQLVNYTDAEAGIPTLSTQTAYREFYNRAKNILQYYFYAKNYYGDSSSHPDYWSAAYVAAHDAGTNDFEYSTTFSLSSYEDIVGAINVFYRPNGSNYIVFTINRSENCLIMYALIGGNASKVASVNTLSQLFIPDKIHTVSYQKITNDANNWRIKVDGKQIPTTVTANALNSPTQSFSVGANIRFWGYKGQNLTLKCYEGIYKIAGSNVGHWQWNNREGRTVKDLTGNSDIDIRFGDQSKTDAGGGAWRENKSNAIPVSKAFRFRKAQKQYLRVPNFLPTSEQGYTTILGFAMESNRTFTTTYSDCFLSARGANGYYLCYGVYMNGQNLFYQRFNESPPVYSFNTRLDRLNLLICTVKAEGNNHRQQYFLNGSLVYDQLIPGAIINLSDINSALYIGSDAFDPNNRNYEGNLFYTAIAKGIITEEQIKLLNNNLNFINPNPAWNNLDWQLIVNFNKINISGTTYTLEDLSGKGHTINMHNFSAANVTPGDPAYALQELSFLKREAWTPKFTETFAWYDYHDTASITKDASNYISRINDKSGNSRHLTASGTERPVQAIVNGMNTASFNGTTTQMAAPIPDTTYQIEVFAVAMAHNLHTGVITGLFNVNNNLDFLELRFNSDGKIIIADRVEAQEVGLGSSNSYSSNTFQFARALFVNSFYRELTTDFSNTTTRFLETGGTHALNNIAIGVKNRPTKSHWLDGRVGEAIYVPGNTGEQTKRKIEGYLAHKWGLTAQLPADHPYKNTIPLT